MTIPYGSKIRALADQLKKDYFVYYKVTNGKVQYKLIDKTFCNGDFELYLNNKEIFQLAKIIHSVLYKTFPSLQIFVDYLKET
jgi:hypothetical protein